MKSKHAAWAMALAAAVAVPALAQTAVMSADTTVTSGTGIVVTPGAPAMVPGTHLVPGAVMAQANQTTTKSGNTTTTTTTYWVNVPADVTRDDRFQRWQRLR